MHSAGLREWPFLGWTTLDLGACILPSPWVFRSDSNRARMWDNLVVGGIVMVLATLNTRITVLMRHRLSGVRPASGLP
jgi:SPW repeat